MARTQQLASGVDSSGSLTKKGNITIAVGTLAAEQARLLSGGSINIAAVTADLKSSTIAATDAALLTGAELNLRGGVVQGARVGLDLEHVSLREKARPKPSQTLRFARLWRN